MSVNETKPDGKCDYPSILNVLYYDGPKSPLSYADAIRVYISMLRNNNEGKSWKCRLAATKLTQLSMIGNNQETLRKLEEIYLQLKIYLDEWMKKVDFPYPISLFKRRKSLTGTLEKIYHCIDKGTYNEINDILGFRIMLDNGGGQDDEVSIHWLYLLVEQVYEFFTKTHNFWTFSFSKTPRENHYKPADEKVAKIFVPESSEIPTFLLESNSMKDYVAFPKENGYQSIHMVFVDAFGMTFEVQFRTQCMHMHAEFGTGNHLKYKMERYERKTGENSREVIIDPMRVNVTGYVAIIDKNGIIRTNDPIGIDVPVDALNFLGGTQKLSEDEIHQLANEILMKPSKVT